SRRSTSGTTTAAPPSMARSWVGRTSCSGTGTTSCSRTRWSSRRRRRRSGESMAVTERLRHVPRDRLLDAFLIANLAVLSLDVFIAHSGNAFREPMGRVPVGFGVLGAGALVVALGLDSFDPLRPRALRVGQLVGWTSLVVGVAGLLFHLSSNF